MNIKETHIKPNTNLENIEEFEYIPILISATMSAIMPPNNTPQFIILGKN